MRIFLVALMITTSGCFSEPKEEVFTLYHTAPSDPSLRLRWATFDEDEIAPADNRYNCEVTSRLLNANWQVSGRGNSIVAQRIGFWCEPGRFVKKGAVPRRFNAEFPTNMREAKRLPR